MSEQIQRKALNSMVSYVLLFALITCTLVFNYTETTFLGIPAYLWVNVLIVSFIGWVFLCILKNRGRAYWNKLFVYPICFAVMCAISTVYSYSPMDTLDRFKRMLIMFALMFSIYQYIMWSPENLERTLKAYTWSGLLAALYLFFNTDSLTGRIGSAIGDANLVGITFAFAVTIAIHFLKTEHRLVYLVPIAVISVAILLTGSRTSMGLLIMAILGNVYLSAYQNKWKMRYVILCTVGIILFLIGFLYLIMTVPLLYNNLGMRVQSFWQIIHGQESVYHESSTQTRGVFALRAFKWFLSSPLMGHGINTFPAYNATFGDGWYCFSHCDYVEILSGLGILGFIFFYTPFFCFIKQILWKVSKKEKRDYKILMGALSCEFLIGEIFLVMYYEKTTWILFAMLSAMYALSKEYKNEKGAGYCKQ